MIDNEKKALTDDELEQVTGRVDPYHQLYKRGYNGHLIPYLPAA